MASGISSIDHGPLSDRTSRSPAAERFVVVHVVGAPDVRHEPVAHVDAGRVARSPPARRRLPMITVGAPVGVGSMLVLAYGRIDQFLVFTIAGSSDAGLYGAMYRILDSWAFLPGSLLITLAPLLAASWPGNRERLLRATRTAAEYLTVGMTRNPRLRHRHRRSVGHDVVRGRLRTGRPGAQGARGSVRVHSFGYLTDNLLLVLGLQTRLVVIALAGLVLNLGANAVMIPCVRLSGARMDDPRHGDLRGDPGVRADPAEARHPRDPRRTHDPDRDCRRRLHGPDVGPRGGGGAADRSRIGRGDQLPGDPARMQSARDEETG